MPFQWRMCFGILICSALCVLSQPPINAGDRPPPKEENAIVKALISELLGAEEEIGTEAPVDSNEVEWPLTLINSSSYWSLDDLSHPGSVHEVVEARKWLEGYLVEAEEIFHIAAEAGWNYFTNLTEHNRRMLVDSEHVLGQFLKVTAEQARQFDLPSFSQNRTLQRILHMLSLDGLSALPPEQFQRLSNVQRTLADVFTNGAVCERDRPPPCTLRYPELQRMMSLNRDPGQLAYVWFAWRHAVGPAMHKPYMELVQLTNEGARMNGFEDAGALWRSPYEETAPSLAKEPVVDLRAELERLHESIKPLYTQLHAYVRLRLSRVFPTATDLTQDGPIPAHLLGSMSGDNWLSLYRETQPYPDDQTSMFPTDPWASPFGPAGPIDPLTQELIRQNYTVRQMFDKAEAFYRSLGFSVLPEKFWNSSVLTRPWNRDVFCHPPTAFDMKDRKDFRIKICADVTKENFVEAHRLLAHTYYQKEYRHQPLTFREGANPSFPQAVADAMGIVAQSSPYLSSVNLDGPSAQQTAAEHSKETESDRDGDPYNHQEINALYEEALQQLVVLPFILSVDLWRWQVYSGQLNESTFNSGWWALRKRMQGITPPDERFESEFDAASTPLVSQQQFPAVRRFMSYVLQFQFLKAMCAIAGFSGPLDVNKCNLIGSKETGRKLRDLMGLGISISWPDALSALSGQTTMDSTPLMEYYMPLYKWLVKQNAKDASYVGWDGPGTPFPLVQSFMPGESVVPGGNDVVIPSRDNAAFPGDECGEPKVCVQESVCNGTHCACKDGMFQWYDHCLPSDPNMSVGFGADGGFSINVIKEYSTDDEEPTTTEEEPSVEPHSSASELGLGFLIAIFSSVIIGAL